MKIVVTTKDEEITLFEDVTDLSDISINCNESEVYISNHKCDCLLDMILDRAYSRSNPHTFSAEGYLTSEVEQIVITMG